MKKSNFPYYTNEKFEDILSVFNNPKFKNLLHKYC